MAEKVMLVGTKSFPFEWRLWLNTSLSHTIPHTFDMMNSIMLTFFLNNHSEFEKRARKFSIFNHNYRCYYCNKTSDYHCLLQCGMNCSTTETMSTERWKQLETKIKIGKFWISLETCLKALTGKKQLKGCSSMKDVH